MLDNELDMVGELVNIDVAAEQAIRIEFKVANPYTGKPISDSTLGNFGISIRKTFPAGGGAGLSSSFDATDSDPDNGLLVLKDTASNWRDAFTLDARRFGETKLYYVIYWTGYTGNNSIVQRGTLTVVPQVGDNTNAGA